MLGILVYALLGMVALLLLFLLNFYRDPKRKIPKGNDIVSPADGRIIKIIKIDSNKKNNKLKIKKPLLGKIETLTKDIANNCYLISIFMSPFDVHVNRSPVDGKISSIKHTKGRFFSAFDFEKSLLNEKNEIIIKNEKMKIKVIQIAGFLARRIKCSVKENQKINKGQKIGSIVLGSQVSLIIPVKVKLKIKIGDKVKAGISVIASSK